MADDYNYELDYVPDDFDNIIEDFDTNKNEDETVKPKLSQEDKKATFEEYGFDDENIPEVEEINIENFMNNKEEEKIFQPKEVVVSNRKENIVVNNTLNIHSDSKIKSDNFDKDIIKHLVNNLERSEDNILAEIREIVDPHKRDEETFSNIHTINPNRPKGNNPQSKMQIVEKSYREIKQKIDIIIASSDDKNQSSESISKQNLKLIKYLGEISQILDVVVESSKISFKPQIKKQKEVRITPPTSNNKLIEVYKKEHIKLQKRFEQISDPNYLERLEDNLSSLNKELTRLENENKQLKYQQKQSEVIFERQYKSNTQSNEEVKKLNQEYENVKKLNEVTFEKAQKNIVLIQRNEEKIQTLTEYNNQLLNIARNMYQIDDYDYLLKEEENEKILKDKRQNLVKKLDVMEKVLHNNKKKYEAEIARNDKVIIQLEKEKLQAMKVLKEKSAEAYKTTSAVKGVYNNYNSILDGNNPIEEEDILHKYVSRIENEEDNRQSVNNQSVNMSNINNSKLNKSIEDTKREILKELDKKCSNDKIESKAIESHQERKEPEKEKNFNKEKRPVVNISSKQQDPVSVDPNTNSNANQSLNKSNKPNFNFNMSKINNNEVKIEAAQLSIKSENTNEIKEEIVVHETKEIKQKELINIDTKGNDIIVKGEIKSTNSNNIHTDVLELNTNEPIFTTNSRRLNNLNKSKEKEKEVNTSIVKEITKNQPKEDIITEPPEFLKEVSNRNNTYSVINPEKERESILTNDKINTNQDLPKRNRGNFMDAEKRSIFDDPKLLESTDKLENNMINPVDDAAKKEFFSLFNYEENKTDIKTTTINHESYRKVEPRQKTNKYADLLDLDLEEIDIP